MKTSKKPVPQKEIVVKPMSPWYMLPIMVVLALVPLIVRLSNMPIASDLQNLPGISNQDFFLYDKSILLIWICAISLFFLASYLYHRKQESLQRMKSSEFISLGIYLFFVFVSAVFSGATSAFIGAPDRCEGFFVVFCYLILFVCSALMADSIKSFRYVIYALSVSAFLMCLIGIPQYFGADFFNTLFGQNLILPEAFKQYVGKLSINFHGQIYSTLYNPNDAGSMFTMLTMLFLPLAAFEKKLVGKIIFFILAIASIFTLLGSESRGGLVGLGFSMVVVLILIVIALRKDKKALFMTMAQVILVAVLSIGVWLAIAGNPHYNKVYPSASFDIKTYDTTANVIIDKGALTLNFKPVSNQNFVSLSANGLNIPVTQVSGGALSFTNADFSKVKLSGTLADTVVNYGTQSFHLRYTSGAGVELLYSGNIWVKTQNDVKYVPFLNAHGAAGSGRGYIWSRTIPMLENTILLGHGRDSFTKFFPQYELGAKQKYLGAANITVNKPHNTYLEMGVEDGCIAVLGFLAAGVFLLIRTFKTTAKAGAVPVGIGYAIAFMGGALAYLGAALFNDDVVAVAPVFWVLLGCAFAADRLVSNTLSKPIKERNK